MPRLPVWLVISVGVIVAAFGVYRLSLVLRSRKDQDAARDKGGLFGYPRRTHGLFGVVYLIMGVLLILGALGVRMPWMK